MRMGRMTADRNVIAALLGHTEIVDIERYQYDISDCSEKKRLLGKLKKRENRVNTATPPQKGKKPHLNL